jgi:hypothetical protein
MKTKTLTTPAAVPAVRVFGWMMEASPYIDAQRAAGKYVTVEMIGEGLKGKEYDEATKDGAVRVTVREFAPGDGATLCMYSDRHACTVIRRTAKTLTLQRDKATLLNGFKSGEKDALQFAPGGFFGHTSGTQRYNYEPDPQGQIFVARLTKRGWRCGCNRIGAGRSEHYDFNF